MSSVNAACSTRYSARGEEKAKSVMIRELEYKPEHTEEEIMVVDVNEDVVVRIGLWKRFCDWVKKMWKLIFGRK